MGLFGCRLKMASFVWRPETRVGGAPSRILKKIENMYGTMPIYGVQTR